MSYKNKQAHPKHNPLKKKIDKLNFIKMKNFCSFYNTVKERKNQPTDLEKIKDFIHKEYTIHNNKKTIFKWYSN